MLFRSLILAVLGVTMNGLAVLRLKKGDKDSINQKAVMLHLMEDALGWLAVLIGSVVMIFAHVPILDPILSILITIYVLYNAIKNLRAVLNIFLQAAPKSFDQHKLKTKILKVEGVLDVHDIRAWSLDGKAIVLSAHLLVADDLRAERLRDIKHAVKQIGRASCRERV